MTKYGKQPLIDEAAIDQKNKKLELPARRSDRPSGSW